MGKEVWVISLGGSRIVPNEVDYLFLEKFKTIIDNNPSKKFVVVTGGGSVARKYIKAMQKFHKNTKKQSSLGIAVTRLNALLMTNFFGK